MTATIGVALGASLRPEALDRLEAWAITLPGVLGFSICCAVAGSLYFRRITGVDRVTAYFAGMPGGLVDMVIQGEAKGANTEFVALVHGSRIFLVVMMVPFLVVWFAGPMEAAGAASSNIAAKMLPAVDWLWLVGMAGFGWGAAAALRLPAAPLLGPMLGSAAVHLMGASDFAVAREVVIVAQVVVGTVIGCRFVGVAFPTVARTLLVSGGYTAILIAITLAFALALSRVTELGFVPILLAYSPGGLAEMGLIAVSLQIEVAFVAAHHIARVLVVMLGATPAFALLFRNGRPGGKS